MTGNNPKGWSITAVLELLGDYVQQHDPAHDPKYAQVAGLLAEAATEAQRHGQVLGQLSARADQLLQAPSAPVVSRYFETQADWCEDILKRSDGPRRYSEIANQMYEEGYRHAVTVKNPERQLRDSIWVAMNDDSRFVKVARGTFDLTARQASD